MFVVVVAIAVVLRPQATEVFLTLLKVVQRRGWVSQRSESRRPLPRVDPGL